MAPLLKVDPLPQVQPLLQVKEISRIYRSDGNELRALDNVSLDIYPGEFVAVVGQSGSGKSTLMNLLGCLDRPSEGQYRVKGRDVAELHSDQLAALRRETFGFVFQRYNLLNAVSASENVELPAVYAGRGKQERSERAQALLARLGLGDRSQHHPNQLSGGQQQRVSIARALMNGAEVILADEPTGALDSKSGQEVLALLQELHREGHTIVLITHDAEVAANADRIIQIKDGRIVEDSGFRANKATLPARSTAGSGGFLPDLTEAVKMALRSLRANAFRSTLTLLGVVIGVAAVVAMLAIGNGSKQDVMDRIESMGTNMLMVFPGGQDARPGGNVASLSAGDAEAIRQLPQVAAVSPERSTGSTLRVGNRNYPTTVAGVWTGYQQVQSWQMASGGFINRDDLRSYAPVVVLGQTVVKNLFPDGEDPLGRYVLVGNIPFEVIGALQGKGANAFGSDQDDRVLIPLSTGAMRVFGDRHLDIIRIKMKAGGDINRLEQAVTSLLAERHGTDDFQVRNTASLMKTAAATQNTLTILLGSVAAISLLVGGIGVMNIMLVNVTERTREIGVRMATGARRSNILLQFNTEALVVCGIGGLVGVLAGIGAGLLAQALGTRVVFTLTPALLAFSSAFFTGLLFGYLPARKAAQMDPVVALATE